MYDDLPEAVKHSSLLPKDDIEDLSAVYNGTQLNRVAYEIAEFEKVLSEVTYKNEYFDILNKYAECARQAIAFLYYELKNSLTAGKLPTFSQSCFAVNRRSARDMKVSLTRRF